jgi:hypothetical protein
MQDYSRDRLTALLHKHPFFETSVGENFPHIGVLAGFPWIGWAKAWGKIQLDSKGIACHYLRCNAAVFFKSERLNRLFSTRTGKEGFMGFATIDQDIRREKGA